MLSFHSTLSRSPLHPSSHPPWLDLPLIHYRLNSGLGLMWWAGPPLLKTMPLTTLELLRCLISSPLVSYRAGAKSKYLMCPPQLSFDSGSQGHFATQMSPMCCFHVSWSISSISPHIGCNVSWRESIYYPPLTCESRPLCLTQRRLTATSEESREMPWPAMRGEEESWTATDGHQAQQYMLHIATLIYWENTERHFLPI